MEGTEWRILLVIFQLGAGNAARCDAASYNKLYYLHNTHTYYVRSYEISYKISEWCDFLGGCAGRCVVCTRMGRKIGLRSDRVRMNKYVLNIRYSIRYRTYGRTEGGGGNPQCCAVQCGAVQYSTYCIRVVIQFTHTHATIWKNCEEELNFSHKF